MVRTFIRGAESAHSIISMFVPVIDRAGIYFVSGILAGLLETASILDPGKHSDNVETIQAIAGPATVAFTLFLGYRHEKHKLNAGVVETSSKYSLQPIFDWIKAKFVVTLAETPTQ